MDTLYDLHGLPNTHVIITESYNASRYSDRFDHEDFSRMTLQELQEAKTRINKDIKMLQEEQIEEMQWNKRSYVIDERIKHLEKLLDKLEVHIADRKQLQKEKHKRAESVY